VDIDWKSPQTVCIVLKLIRIKCKNLPGRPSRPGSPGLPASPDGPTGPG